MGKKSLALGVCVLMLLVIFSSENGALMVDGEENSSSEKSYNEMPRNLTTSYEDVLILDADGNEISEATYGATVSIKFTIHNIGDKDRNADVYLDVVSYEDSSSAVLKYVPSVIIPANEAKEFTCEWKTDEVIGTSAYYATPGTYYFYVTCEPGDWDTQWTDGNLFLSTRNNVDVTLVQSSEGEGGEEQPDGSIPSFEAVYLLAIIGICILLLRNRRKQRF